MVLTKKKMEAMIMMNNKKLFLDVHAIQTLPPANINRDDTGSPKSAQYGGVTRARVSSQAWKKAIRQYFLEFGDLRNVGVRSLEVVRYIASKIMVIDSSKNNEQATDLAKKVFAATGIKLDSDYKTKALFFISSKQAENLAQIALNGGIEEKEIKKMLSIDPSIDIALFGRMVADDPSLNEDASCQVAHAISTHAVQAEFDYFTALDDFSSSGDAGAAMIDTIEFNSSTLYRYANVAIHEFLRQIGDTRLMINALILFIEAFTKSLPTGKINTFANQTLPQALLVTLRTDRPVSLVSAFERPIYSDKGYVEQSISRLNDEYENVLKWVENPLYVLSVGMGDFTGNLGDLNELFKRLEEKLLSLLSN